MERYSFEKAQNEANEMHKLIKNKGAGNYEEAERKIILKQLQERIDPEEMEELNLFFEELEDGIDDLEEAKERIREMRNIISPVISVPKQYINDIEKQGYITAKPSWTGHKILAATFGRDFYVGNSDERIFFKIKPHVPLEPRFTGKDKLFHGVVIMSNNKLNLNRDLERLN